MDFNPIFRRVKRRPGFFLQAHPTVFFCKLILLSLFSPFYTSFLFLTRLEERRKK
jgi:hypothetical protein